MINNDRKLNLDMVMLKNKICSLFGFRSDIEFTMTYVDVDGDAITLVDDADLRDVVRQALNPLRITVKLKTNNFHPGTTSYVSRTSVSHRITPNMFQTPHQQQLRLLQLQQQQQQLLQQRQQMIRNLPRVQSLFGNPNNEAEPLEEVVDPIGGGAGPSNVRVVPVTSVDGRIDSCGSVNSFYSLM